MSHCLRKTKFRCPRLHPALATALSGGALGARMPLAGNRFQTVFIGNLSYDGTEDELRSLFAQIGPISTLRVVVDRETGKRKGFAFLEFFDQDTAQRAVHELDGAEWYGRALRLRMAEQDIG